MGTFFNPDNGSFKHDSNDIIYIDKTGLLEVLNKMLFTSMKCVALSHARRFGKSQAAGMIDAYYSLGSDSRELFSRFEIAKAPDFETHLNKYNVIHIDISSAADFHKDDLVQEVKKRITDDFRLAYGDELDYTKDLNLLINDIFLKSGKAFVIIIDEWDCVIRNHADRPDLVHEYLQFLHSLFKSEESKSYLALAYITGILPIKKIHDESALNNFEEYTMVDSGELTEYFGFTEEEVNKLCIEYGMDYDSVKNWYNGYLINGRHMYNPNSVSRAMMRKKLDSYWKNTSAYSTINDYITLNFDGLKDDVLKMLAGEKVKVNVKTFRNDLKEINSRNDALTALIHLGYLGYNAERKKAYLPNYEVGTAFESALETGSWKEVATSISRCDDLLWSTIDREEERVAELIELAHEAYTSIIKYNYENSLSCVLTMAYFTAPEYYNIVREMPAAKGFADLVFIPRREAGTRPAMIVELKWDQSSDTAINQIKEKRYAGALSGYEKEILLVGISYDTKTKKHSCVIEEI